MVRMRRFFLFVLSLALLVGLGAVHSGMQPVAADGTASVSCVGGSTGVDDCMITLNTTIAAGGSFTATVTDAGAMILGCNTIPIGGPCTNTATTATFSCPNACTSGSVYRDVVQLTQGSGMDQSFSVTGTTSGASATNSSTPSQSTSVYPVSSSATSPIITTGGLCATVEGGYVPCSTGGLLTLPSCTGIGFSVVCGNGLFGNLTGFSGGCLFQGATTIVNLCQNGFAASCNPLGQPSVLNLCSGGASIIPTTPTTTSTTQSNCFGINGLGQQVNLCAPTTTNCSFVNSLGQVVNNCFNNGCGTIVNSLGQVVNSCSNSGCTFFNNFGQVVNSCTPGFPNGGSLTNCVQTSPTLTVCS